MKHRVLSRIILGVACIGLTGFSPDGNNRIIPENPSPAVKLLSGGDVLVTGLLSNNMRPSMTSAPNGDLFVAPDNRDSGTLQLYKSTDGGHTWSSFASFFAPGYHVRNPSIAYGELSGGERWVFVAYELVDTSDDTRRVEVYRVDPDGVDTSSWTTIDGPYIMNGTDDEIHPQIITDIADWGDTYFVYVTYQKFALDSYQVYFSRSMNRGDSWSTPLDVTGGSLSTAWSTRPEIAYGKASGLFIAFVKPGWNGVSNSNQIWVTRSGNFGASFSTPVQVTDTEHDHFHPSIAAAHATNRVVVAFTRDFGTDLDAAYKYSSDMGATWAISGSMPWTSDHESSVDLTVSDSDDFFHAAYKHEAIAGGEDQVWYTRAGAATFSGWSRAQTINDGETASGIAYHPRPTITLIAPEGEPAIAWTDYRGTSYGVYFDTFELFSDGFESGNTSAWSSTVP